MRYRGSLTIPANTLQSSPATRTVALTDGRILEALILFVPGQAGITHLIVTYHERQILPSSPEADFIGSRDPILVAERFPVYDLPFEVELVGWSPGSVLEHTVYVDFTVEPDQPVMTLYPASVALPEKP
jgi:hypothetical protein